MRCNPLNDTLFLGNKLNPSLTYFQPSPVYFNSASPPINSYPANFPQYCQAPSHQQASHSSTMSSYLDISQSNSMPSVLTSASINGTFYPEFSGHPIAPGDNGGNFPCTFHQYSWLKSTNPEFWWNTPGAGKQNLCSLLYFILGDIHVLCSFSNRKSKSNRWCLTIRVCSKVKI